MSARDKLIFLIGAVVLVIIGIAVVFLISRTSSQGSPIFGKIERPDLASVIRLRSKTLNVDFKTDVEAPKTAQVYKINDSEVSSENAAKIAVKLGFTAKPTGSVSNTWKKGNNTLDINRSKRSLTIHYPNVEPLKGKFSADKLAKTALTFMKKGGLSTEDLTPDTSNLRLLENEGAVTKSTNPVFIEIAFNRKLGMYNVFSTNPAEPAAVVALNNKGQISWVYYKFADINKTTVGIYPLTDIKNLETAKLVKFGTLVFPQTGRDIFDPALIKTITIEDFSLGYLDDQVGEFVQPIYILRGYSTVGTESISVVIYYPALQEEWLK